MNDSKLRSAPVRFWLPVLAVVLFSSCSLFKRQGSSAEPLIFDIGPRTTRADVVRQTTVALNSFGFLIEYTDARKDYSALVTEWRRVDTGLDDPELQEAIQTRDRALLHMSPRGYQGDRVSLVVSKLQFEVQLKMADDDVWNTIDAPKDLVREYKQIVNEIRRRLSVKGYKF